SSIAAAFRFRSSQSLRSAGRKRHCRLKRNAGISPNSAQRHTVRTVTPSNCATARLVQNAAVALSSEPPSPLSTSPLEAAVAKPAFDGGAGDPAAFLLKAVQSTAGLFCG